MTEERKNKMIKVLQCRQQNLTVVMENILDPHNVFAVMRTCDAVGIQDVYIINTKMPGYKKAGKSSGRSAGKWLTLHHFDNAADCVKELKKQYKKILTTYLSNNSVSLYKIDFTESIALVFGNEQKGVSEELMSMADGNFIIPQMGMIPSLNVSVACAVSLYEAYRQKQIAGHYNESYLSKEPQDVLLKEWGLSDS